MKTPQERMQSAKQGAVLMAFVVGLTVFIGGIAYDYGLWKAAFFALLAWIITVSSLITICVVADRRGW
jgi:hypothetical protein